MKEQIIEILKCWNTTTEEGIDVLMWDDYDVVADEIESLIATEVEKRMRDGNTYADGYVDGYFDSGKTLPPSIGLDEADELVQKTDYIIEATHQDVNPINLGDASAFFIEGYEYCRSRLTENKQEGGEG